MVNYLARLGWSHGDEEVFSREQLVEWFDLAHCEQVARRAGTREAQVDER
jgi:glutamyl-tRNA synthetase